MKLFSLFKRKQGQPSLPLVEKPPIPCDVEAIRLLLDGFSTDGLIGLWLNFNNINDENPADPNNSSRKELMKIIDRKVCQRIGKEYAE